MKSFDFIKIWEKFMDLLQNSEGWNSIGKVNVIGINHKT